MTDAIGPNMNVVCISNAGNNLQQIRACDVTVGAIYFVSKVGSPGPNATCLRCPVDDCGTIGLRLRGKPRVLYCPNQFKPLGGDVQLTEKEADIPEEFKQPLSPIVTRERVCEVVDALRTS